MLAWLVREVASEERECGSCTLCCKLLHIPEFDAPAGIWCSQCDVKKGCKIHGNHPKQCKDFKCLWLLDVGLDIHRPDKSKMVMKFVKAHQDGVTQLQIYCNDGYPDAWKIPYVKAMIDKLTDSGGRTIIIYGDKRTAIGSRKVMKEIDGRILNEG